MAEIYFRREFTGKMLRYQAGVHTARRPAQWRCAWICHKSRFWLISIRRVLHHRGTGCGGHTLFAIAPTRFKIVFYGNSQKRCRPTRPGCILYASPRSGHTQQHVIRAISIFCNFNRKMPRHKTGAGVHILFQPAQWRCMLTWQKSHFWRKRTGKTRAQSVFMPVCKGEIHTNSSQEPFCTECLQRNAASSWSILTKYRPCE